MEVAKNDEGDDEYVILCDLRKIAVMDAAMKAQALSCERAFAKLQKRLKRENEKLEQAIHESALLDSQLAVIKIEVKKLEKQNEEASAQIQEKSHDNLQIQKRIAHVKIDLAKQTKMIDESNATWKKFREPKDPNRKRIFTVKRIEEDLKIGQKRKST